MNKSTKRSCNAPSRRKRLPVVLSQLLAAGLLSGADAATIEVVAGEVAKEDNGLCSIVEAVINANQDDQSGSNDCAAGSAADTLVLPEDSEFRFVSADPDSARALPSITSTISIQGNGATLVRDPSADVLFGLIEVAVDGQLTLNSVTVADGRAPPGFSGGGISNVGQLTMLDSIVSGNSAGTAGGGIVTRGSTILTRTTVSGNTARFDGGGIMVLAGELNVNRSDIVGNTAGRRGGGVNGAVGALSISRSNVSDNMAEAGGGISARLGFGDFSLLIDLVSSTVSGNMATTSGGGIRLEAFDPGADIASLNIVASVLHSNTASTGFGGALEILGPAAIASLSNSTLSNNQASVGAGIEHSQGSLDIEYTTFANNTASSAGDDLSWSDAEQGDLQLRNSILASTNLVCNIANGNLTEDRNNLIVDDSCAGNAIEPVLGDPMLGPLADNGGATLTHALLQGSDAIDAADQQSCPATDQRGVARSDAACDIGAFEFVPVSEVIFSDSFEPPL